MATEQDLNAYLDSTQPSGFNSVAHYFPDGDHVTFYVSNERCYERRLDDLVTEYISMKTDRLVGIKVKGIKRILDQLGGRDFIVMVTKQPITVGLLLVGAALLEPNSRAQYAMLGQQSVLNIEVKDVQLASAA